MARSSTVHYIAPSAFDITPNCNGSENDLDVFLSARARIRVYSPGAGVGYEDNTYQEWTLKGRNRRLSDSARPYTVYARLPKYDKGGGYLVFAPMNGSAGAWTDKYAYLTATGIARPAGSVEDADNWYVRMGEVSLPQNGQRTVDFDTGILGTDQYWTEEGEIHGLYISKVDDDEAHGLIGFRKGLWVGERDSYGFTPYGDLSAGQGIMDLLVSRNFLSGPDGEGFRLVRDAGNGVSELEADRATIREKMYANWLQSSDYTGEGMLDTGFRLWYENGRSKLVIDDLVARGKFSVYELESRIMTHAGGDVCFSGAGSKLFFVEYLDAAGEPLGYTTINSPLMLRDKFLLAGASGLAAWANRRKIQRQLTQAQKAAVRKFRCYVFSDDGTMRTRNWWHVHDLARCQTFDRTQTKQTAEGYYSGDDVSNTVYWRRVAGIGSKRIEALGDNKIYDYFDLWNVPDVTNETWFDPLADEGRGAYVRIGFDIPEERYTTPGYLQTSQEFPYGDWPAAGDDVVQFGNARDVGRQAVNVLQVTGGEPGLKVYHGIHDYRTDDTKWVDIGYDATLQRAKADVFGDFYFGARGSVDPRDGSTYVRYNAGTKRLDIKAHITAASTYGDNDLSLDNYIKGVTWTKSEIEEMIGDGVEVVQNQLDGNFSIWYKDIAPLPLEDSAQGAANAPASGWNTDALKEEHLYDMYYDRIADRGYRWTSKTVGDVKKYYWEQLGNNSILASLRAAANAQDTADGKRRVFVCDGETHETPTPPYDEGDLWVNADYIDPTTHEVVFDNDLVRCNHTRATGNFSISDWEKASKYTDDSGLINFVDVTYNADMAQLHKQIDGKIDTYFTDTDPSTSWTAAQKEEHVDDVWFNTDSERLFRYKKTESGGTVSYSWDEIYDDMALQAYKDAAKAQDTADGKRRVFVAQPTADDEYDIGDLWVNATYGTTYSNDLLRCKTHKDSGTAFNISHWEKATKYTDNTELENFVDNTYNPFVTDIQSQVDGKAETWYQKDNPEEAWYKPTQTPPKDDRLKHVGDLWYCTEDNPNTDYKKGTTWFYKMGGTVSNPTYTWEQQDVPEAVFDKIDGKAAIYVSWQTEWDTSTESLNTGDMLVPTADITKGVVTYKAQKVYKWNGTAWQEIAYTDDSALMAFINGDYADDLNTIQGQIDHKAETWYQPSDPSTPWYDDTQTPVKDERSKHVGDIWMDTSANGGKKTYVYQNTGTEESPVYEWEAQNVPDDVFDTIDGKAEIFVGDTLPTDYNVNDMWIIGENVAKTNLPTGCKKQDIVISSTKSSTYNKNHWSKKDHYSDGSELTDWISNTYNSDQTNIYNQIDQKAETWYQRDDPSEAWTTTELKNTHKGDIWHNTSNTTIAGVGADLDAIWSGMAWVVSDVPQGVYDKIDGKADIFVTKPTTYNQDDMWIIESGLSSTDMPSGCQSGDIVIADNMPSGTSKRTSYVKGDWRKKDRYTDDSSFNSYINEIINGTGASGDAKTAADAARVLNGALKAKTEQDGGLMLTSTLVMRNKNNDDSYTTWGGLNGVYSSGSTIAAWFGGGMIDHEASGSPSTGYATSLFRMNGSGYVAGGNISWNANGEVTIQGKVVQATTIKIGDTSIDNYFVKKSWFDDIFQIFNDTTRIHSNSDLPTDKSKVNIKAMFGFWTEFYLSALGTGGQSSLNIYLSQLGDVNVSGVQTGQYLKYDGQRWIASSVSTSTSLAALTDVNVNGVSDGQALIYDGNLHKWIPGESGLVRQVNVGNTPYSPTNGVVTLPAYPTTLPASDVSAWAKANTKPSYNLDEVSDGTTRKLSDYLPKSGGAMTGVITRESGGRWIEARDYAIIKTTKTSQLNWEWHPVLAVKTSVGCWSFGNVGGETLAISYDTDANYTADNNESSVIYFPSAGSTGTLVLTSQLNDYLPKSGGTLTGALTAKAEQHDGYYGLNMNNSDIIGVNSICTADLSEGWSEGIKFKRTNSNYDTFRAADGVFYFGADSGKEKDAADIGAAAANLRSVYTNAVRPGNDNNLWLYANTNTHIIADGPVILKTNNDLAVASYGRYALAVGGDPRNGEAHIGIDNNEIMAKGSASTSATLSLNAEGGDVCINNNNVSNCGIGTSTPQHKLHVNGGIYASSYISTLSDERKKDIVEDVSLTVEQVAEAPSVKFLWKDGNDKELHVGSIAQYWQKVLPETVMDADGVLSMDYSTISLSSAVATARKVVEQQQEIDRLKAEIEDMKKMIRQLVKEK